MLLEGMTKHEGGRYADDDGFLPWYTSTCLEWLLTLELRGRRVWEYGGGDSTDWYRRQGAKVNGVETDKIWAEKCGFFHVTDEGDFPVMIMKTGIYDLIIVDGISRDDCICFAWGCLRSGGYMIFDNWKQATVQPEWPITEKLIEGMEQTLYEEPNHWDRWSTLVVKKPL